MHLLHVGLEGARRRKLSGAELAGEVSVLLMLEQNVGILELFLAVVAEGFQHVDASLFAPHLFLSLTKLLIIIKQIYFTFAIKMAGLLDTVMTTAMTGYLSFTILNRTLERFFF